MENNPCLAHDCHVCCLGTMMTLTGAEVARLEARGRRRFCRENADGDLQLVNVDGACVFLADGRCSVYADRPDGCRLYPLVLDLDDDRVELHDVCPYRDEFSFAPDDERRLRASIATEERERLQRCGAPRSDQEQHDAGGAQDGQ